MRREQEAQAQQDWCRGNPAGCAAKAAREAEQAQDLMVRGGGVLQAAGGVAQVTAGAAGVAAPTGATQAMGLIALVHGLDDLVTGLQQAFTGVVHETTSGEAIRGTLEAAGVSPGDAETLSRGLEGGIALGATATAAQAVPRVVKQSAGVPEGGGPPPRPSWQNAQDDTAADLREFGFKEQKSYRGKAEVPYGTPDSVRPDMANESLKLSVEVKNYNVTTAQGRYRLVQDIVEQAKTRAGELPEGMRQGVTIDIRGQNVSDKLVERMVNRIVRRSDGLIEADNIVVRR